MKKLQIAVGIIRNENNEIFITRRAADAHMANKLEFPGGKIEMGETNFRKKSGLPHNIFRYLKNWNMNSRTGI